MIRGFRGATTVSENIEAEMMDATKNVLTEMVKENKIAPSDISHVFFSVTDDLNAAFPAKVARELPGWTHVPVMCMQEIAVPNSLKKCIRVMLVAKTNVAQDKITHVFQNDAVKLRPDLLKEEGE